MTSMHAEVSGSAVTGGHRSRLITALLLCVCGFAFTVYVFDPGVMTIDARYVYTDMTKNFLGDWQSPVMTVAWRLIDPIAPGSRSLFLLDVALYWLAFGLMTMTLARYSWMAIVLPLLAVSPPAFVLVGIIWRDVLFAGAWILAAALIFAAHDSARSPRRWAQLIAAALLIFGVLLRPNAIPAAPLLAAYIYWPGRWRLKQTLAVYLPTFIVLVAIVPFFYYTLLGATRQHPLHGLLVFDLGGISHFTKQNQFPVSWPPDQMRLLLDGCYKADKWDGYWYLEPCKFVMAKLEGEKIFGTTQLTNSWLKAVWRHPVAYVRHRLTFMRSFLTGTNLVMWTQDINDPSKLVFSDRPVFSWFLQTQEKWRSSWIFKPATWLVLCVALIGLAWRDRATNAGAFVFGTCGAGAVYVASYLAFGVASDYRYAYFAVLAALAGIAVVLTRAVAPSDVSDKA